MEGGLRRKAIIWLGTTYSEGMNSLWKDGTAQGGCSAHSKGLPNWTQNSQAHTVILRICVISAGALRTQTSAEALWLMLFSKPKVTSFIFQSSILYSLNPC